jgi:hypothetical protein
MAIWLKNHLKKSKSPNPENIQENPGKFKKTPGKSGKIGLAVNCSSKKLLLTTKNKVKKTIIN